MRKSPSVNNASLTNINALDKVSIGRIAELYNILSIIVMRYDLD